MPETTLSNVPQNHRANFAAPNGVCFCVEERDRLETSPVVLDNQTVEAIERALCASGYPALRSVQVELERGIAVLWGRVPTYYQKQLAQVTVQKLGGVRGVANGIEVICRRDQP